MLRAPFYKSFKVLLLIHKKRKKRGERRTNFKVCPSLAFMQRNFLVTNIRFNSKLRNTKFYQIAHRKCMYGNILELSAFLLYTAGLFLFLFFKIKLYFIVHFIKRKSFVT